MKLIFRILGLLLVTGLALLFIGRAYVEHWSQQPLELDQVETLTVRPGSSLYQLSRKLEKAGRIDHGVLFRLYGRLHREGGLIKAGEYELSPGMTPADLYAKLVAGAVLQYSVTLVDGQTYTSFRDKLSNTPKLKYTLDQQDIGELLKSWGSDQMHPEGLFFPDTYTFQNGDTDVAILQRAYRRMQSQLETAWEGRAEGLPYKNAYEALIMASIVEKETGVPEERGLIAGVFINRLKRHMRLQTDPTVIYGLGEQYKGNLKKKHLNQYTPYNTYRIDGLPPTPIANPGLAAIDAALHPAPTQALYFVAKGDGSHQFSDTLAQHEAAVRKYQLKRRTDYHSSPK